MNNEPGWPQGAAACQSAGLQTSAGVTEGPVEPWWDQNHQAPGQTKTCCLLQSPNSDGDQTANWWPLWKIHLLVLVDLGVEALSRRRRLRPGLESRDLGSISCLHLLKLLKILLVFSSVTRSKHTAKPFRQTEAKNLFLKFRTRPYFKATVAN